MSIYGLSKVYVLYDSMADSYWTALYFLMKVSHSSLLKRKTKFVKQFKYWEVDRRDHILFYFVKNA
jgi:hypothetical protein